jgi:hypothetical protein
LFHFEEKKFKQAKKEKTKSPFYFFKNSIDFTRFFLRFSWRMSLIESNTLYDSYHVNYNLLLELSSFGNLRCCSNWDKRTIPSCAVVATKMP